MMGSHKVPQTEGYQVMLPVGRNLSATPHMTASATHHVQKAGLDFLKKLQFRLAFGGLGASAGLQERAL